MHDQATGGMRQCPVHTPAGLNRPYRTIVENKPSSVLVTTVNHATTPCRYIGVRTDLTDGTYMYSETPAVDTPRTWTRSLSGHLVSDSFDFPIDSHYK